MFVVTACLLHIVIDCVYWLRFCFIVVSSGGECVVCGVSLAVFIV